MQITTILQAYLNTQEIRPSTKGVYQNFISKHIVPYFGAAECSELSTEKIEGFASFLAVSGLTPAKIRAIVSFMKKGLKGQYKRDIFSLDLKTGRAKGITVLSLHDQKRLESQARLSDSANKVGVFLCLYTGIRIGELCGLMWQDICFKTKLINVNRNVQRIKNEENDSFPKTKVVLMDLTGKSKRSIPIADFLVDMLYEHKNTFYGKYVISHNAHPVEPRIMQYRLKNLLQEAGLDSLNSVNFSTLRHTFATRALENDFGINALSEILGHASPVITCSRYVKGSGKMDLKRFYMVKFAQSVAGA